MWFIIAKKEIQNALKTKMFYIVTAIIWLLLTVASIGGYKNYKTAQTSRAQASQLFRQQWEEQKANPHSAAHFGTYLFKPLTYLSLFDLGLSNYTGTTYRVEAHQQHDVNAADVQQSDVHMRFGELSVALIFQLLIPLIIIFMAFSSITTEREEQTLKMLYIQGIKPVNLLWGKIAGHYILILGITLPAFMLMMLSLQFNLSDEASFLRLLFFVLSYCLYFFIVVVLVNSVSAIAKSSGSSLLINLGIWVCFCIFLPRFVTGIADQAYQLPSRFEFDKSVSIGFSKGIDGDINSTERRAAYMKEILAQYKVDTVTKLPVNFDGLSLQYSEEYNNKVYKKYAQNLESTLIKQQQLIDVSSFLNPFMAIQQISTGLAGTDIYHHIHFHHQAMEYRNQFIRTLNLDMAYSGSEYLTYDYTVGPDFFKKMKDFEYLLPNINRAFHQHIIAWISLVFWFLLMLFFINFISKRIAVI